MIPAHYPLRETGTARYAERTRLNVEHSDATLILHRGRLTAGTDLTGRLAVAARRPVLTVLLDGTLRRDGVLDWLRLHAIGVLSVAGPRERQEPGIGRMARLFVGSVIAALDAIQR
jgi:hypothetical protein